jgi:hypothetical protein
MRTQVTDNLGDYQVNVGNKPQELENASAIYLNLFDNGDKVNAARYKLALSVVTDEGEHLDWYCSILNDFEPNLFYRSIPTQLKEAPFYRQVHEFINNLKRSGIIFDKKPSAGLFKLPRKKGMQAEQRKLIYNAIGFMMIEKDALPLVSIRFMDFTWNGELQPTGNERGPKWSVCLKSNTQEQIDDDIDYADYF